MRRLTLFLLTLMPLAGQVPAPRLSMDADGAAVMTLRQGRPLFVNALLSHNLRANSGAAPIILKPATGGWSDGIKLVVLDAAGQEASWPMMAGRRSSPSIRFSHFLARFLIQTIF